MSDQLKRKVYGLTIILLLSAGLGLGVQNTLEVYAQTQITSQQTPALQEAKRLNTQITKLYKQGKYSEAIPLAERALQLRESAYGKDHPDVAQSLNNLALLYKSQGLYAKAEPLYMRSLSIAERAYGKDHPNVATSLNNLAGLYDSQGLYAKAEPLYMRSLSIFECAYGKAHPDVATSLNNLAEMYRAQGLDAKAEPLYMRSLSIFERAYGKDHPDVAQSLNNLAGLYDSQGLYAEAELLYMRSLSIFERVYDKDHPLVAASLNNLAGLYHAQGLYTKAEPLLIRSLSIDERIYGKNHPDVAQSLNNLAFLYYAQGLYGKAEPLYMRSLSIWKRAYGRDHPDVATSLSNLASLYYAQGKLSFAVQYLDQGLSIEETNLIRTLILGSEQRKQTYISTVAGTTHSVISLAIESKSSLPNFNRLALTTVLRRKGRVLDAVSTNVQTLLGQKTNDPAAQKLFNEWQSVLQQQSNLVYRGLGNQTHAQYKAEYDRLETEKDRLETDISKISSKFQTEIKPIELAAVQQQIPTDAALIEIVQYQPFNPKAKESNRWGKTRYAAYILTDTGEPKGIDLGEATKIESKIEVFRQSIADSSTSLEQIQQSGRDLEQLIIQPVRRLLGNKRQLLLSPDGELNRVPFEALVNAQGKHLIEEFDISYLTSGRDLLKFSEVVSSRQPALVVGGIDYGQPQIASHSNPTQPDSRSSKTRSSDLTALQFSFLYGTIIEAQAIQSLLSSAQLFLGKAATESALKRINVPDILHLATHGFFLEDQTIRLERSLGNNSLRPPNPETLKLENPLLRSGLALAGVNERYQANTNDDGVLTALEVAGLNLHGTQLVVLSACDTGQGNIRIGEGLYGLRRALVIAGSQSQILSLWKVSDEQTQSLMKQYYQNLRAGQGRHAALKSAQLAMLRDGRTQHPYYWAAFLPSGNWTPLKLNATQ